MPACPPCRRAPETRRRLAVLLVGSLLAHGLVLLLAGKGSHSGPPAAMRLQASLRPLAPLPERDPAPAIRSAKSPLLSAPHAAAARQPVTPAAPENGSSAATTPAAAELREAALAAARREGARMADNSFPQRADAAPSSAIARALAPRASGETRLGENAVRIVTADGREHCVLRMPESVAAGIPGDSGRLAIPVNCPLRF